MPAIAAAADAVIAAARAAEARGDSIPAIAHSAARAAAASGADLADALTGDRGLCFANNTPAMWKLLEFSMASRLVAPIHALSLLTQRVVPHRRAQRKAYRLYLELLRRYAVSALSPELADDGQKKQIAISIDAAFKLSHTYGQIDFGKSILLFLLHTITTLINCISEDYSFLLESTHECYNCMSTGVKEAFVDIKRCLSSNNAEHHDNMKKKNTLLAVEIVGKLVADKKIQVLLHLVYVNMLGLKSSMVY